MTYSSWDNIKANQTLSKLLLCVYIYFLGLTWLWYRSMGHSVRIKFTNSGLLIYLASHFTTEDAYRQHFVSISIFSCVCTHTHTHTHSVLYIKQTEKWWGSACLYVLSKLGFVCCSSDEWKAQNILKCGCFPSFPTFYATSPRVEQVG